MVTFHVIMPAIVLTFVVASQGLKIGEKGVCIKKLSTYTRIQDCDPQNHPNKCRKRVIEEHIVCCQYWEYQENLDKCVPKCQFGCTGGTCVAPDICRCDPPLKLRNHTCVPPVCDPPCQHATCINDDTCECLPNYHAVNETHCLPTCDLGYFNDPEDCHPICTTPCVNAICTAPETCTCIEGHTPFDESTCVPHCDFICGNGECTAPNQCTCNAGYRADPDAGYNCLPVCDPPCENGICVSPNQCSCNAGYEIETRCKPTCDNCSNGYCVALNTCICKEGYVKKEGRCVAHCDSPCVHGYCSKPNECACNTGYKLDPHDKLSCVPICEPECVNGRCIGPNDCECDEYYHKVGSRCASMDEDCKNGQYYSSTYCQCDWGFELITIDGLNTCIPICHQECINATCRNPDWCECLKGYEPTDNPDVCRPM